MRNLRQRLNEELPWETIVRYPTQTSLDKISLTYYQNTVEVMQYVRETVGFDGSRVSDEFHAVLEDGFKDWLLEGHRIAVLGKKGKRKYKGQSDPRIPVLDNAGKLRTDNKVVYPFSKAGLEMIFDVAKEKGDTFTFDAENFEEWQEKIREGFTVHSLIPGVKFEEEDLDRFKKEGAFGFSYCNKGSSLVEHVFPDHSFIESYLGVMNQYLKRMVDSLEKGNQGRTFGSIAKYYVTGIRSQAVVGVWNSLLMTQVNEFLDMAGFERTRHWMYDLLAMSLSSNNFAQYFSDCAKPKKKSFQEN